MLGTRETKIRRYPAGQEGCRAGRGQGGGSSATGSSSWSRNTTDSNLHVRKTVRSVNGRRYANRSIRKTEEDSVRNDPSSSWTIFSHSLIRSPRRRSLLSRRRCSTRRMKRLTCTASRKTGISRSRTIGLRTRSACLRSVPDQDQAKE